MSHLSQFYPGNSRKVRHGQKPTSEFFWILINRLLAIIPYGGFAYVFITVCLFSRWLKAHLFQKNMALGVAKVTFIFHSQPENF